jgi:hypothetical protein
VGSRIGRVTTFVIPSRLFWRERNLMYYFILSFLLVTCFKQIKPMLTYTYITFLSIQFNY